MHPITVMEITISVALIIIIFTITLLLPKKFKKVNLIIVSSITILLLSFLIIRPVWIDYHVSKKVVHLNQYLEKKYPNQKWEIRQKEGRQYNPYHLEVTFENEKGWTYTYSVADEKNICQNVWTPPGDELPREGKHYESEHCK